MELWWIIIVIDIVIITMTIMIMIMIVIIRVGGVDHMICIWSGKFWNGLVVWNIR